MSEAVGQSEAQALLRQGFALREQQRMGEAQDAFARATQLRPDSVMSAMGLAQIRYECGLSAVQEFQRALALSPDNPGALRGLALALAADGQGTAAQDLLAAELAKRPEWIEGHQCLASLRWTGGDTSGFARSYAEACRQHPQNPQLRLAWFRAMAQSRDWETARAIVADGERLFGATREFVIAKLFIASESGARAEAEQLFAATEALRDPVRDMAYVRHCLRTGRPELGEPVALAMLDTPSAPVIWPYLSLLWRLRGDARAAWLDGAPPFVRTYELGLSAAQWEELAALLRQLHGSKSPYLEQSVRGGTQTNGQLFFRTEPIVRVVRESIEVALADYVAALPAPDAKHPLLGPRRGGRFLYAGSWSVRLHGSGFHVSHTHAMGWISSALYVALPEPHRLGAAPAGWLSVGTPPAELGLDLSPYQQIEPRRGRLVLFPSTLWHCTVPFADGERLSIAFDIRKT